MSGAIAAYSSTVKASGTAVPVTGEACTSISGSDPNKRYQVAATGRRIWDPTAAITVKDGGSTVSAALYTFDYLFGYVQFAGHSVTGSITVDGSYLPVVTVATVRKYSLKLGRDQLDDSSFDDGDDWRRFLSALGSGSVDMELLSKLSATMDSEAGGLFTYLTSGRLKVIELGNDGTNFWRLWMRGESMQESGDVAGLVLASMTWKQAANTPATVSYGS